MTGGNGVEPDEAERLKELGHLSAAVGHHVINAFSAVVSNAELIRSHAKSPNCDLAELAALGSAIIENALGASHVPRRLIDWTRRFTSPGFDQTADPVVLLDLNELVRQTAELHQGPDGTGLHWVLNLNPIPMIRGSESQIRSMLGYLIQNAREAMPKGHGTMTVTTRLDPRNWVIMEIRDSGSRDDTRGPQACDRAVLHDQAGAQRRRPDRRPRHLAPPPRRPVDREPAGRRDDDPPGRRGPRAAGRTSKSRATGRSGRRDERPIGSASAIECGCPSNRVESAERSASPPGAELTNLLSRASCRLSVNDTSRTSESAFHLLAAVRNTRPRNAPTDCQCPATDNSRPIRTPGANCFILGYGSCQQFQSAGTDQRHGVNFDHQGGSALGGWTRCNETGAHTDRARHTAKRAERRQPQSGVGVPPVGADELTRCSSSLSPVQRMGPPPIHWQQTAAGLNRMARPAGRSPPRGAACGFWSRAWGRREPAAEATGRWHRPAQGRAGQGGLDIPGRWRPMPLTSRRAPEYRR